MSGNTPVIKLQQTQCNDKLKSSLENVRPHNTNLKFQEKKNIHVEVQSKQTIEEMVGWFQYALNHIQQTCIALGERE